MANSNQAVVQNKTLGHKPLVLQACEWLWSSFTSLLLKLPGGTDGFDQPYQDQEKPKRHSEFTFQRRLWEILDRQILCTDVRK